MVSSEQPDSCWCRSDWIKETVGLLLRLVLTTKPDELINYRRQNAVLKVNVIIEKVVQPLVYLFSGTFSVLV